MQAILAERGIIRATLAGIPKRDRADVEQEVFLGAWRAVRRGKYRPDPKDKPRDALRKWLHGIAWRQASKYFESAYVRRFILDPQPLGRLRGVVGPELHAQIEARDLLRAIERLRPEHQAILLAVDSPLSMGQYARELGLNRNSAASRLRLARKMLMLSLRRLEAMPMNDREMKRRRRLRLPGPIITGEASREDVSAYLRARWWSGSSSRYLVVSGDHAVPVPSRDDYTLEEVIAAIAKAEHRSPGETLRAIEGHTLGLSAFDRAPHLLRLAQEDLSALADETGVLDRFPGVRPWDPWTLWSAVLDFGLSARKPRDREAFHKALGALKALDAMERGYVRKGGR
ncbi:RNA polymerase sigma factor [Sorangium sp. So ce1097]|uniref:RNA polymerase sigma factor n=1 Tax=Sorangium sp. So ce1097 TaxID=3133330 RepID=UPI003F5DC015